MSQQRWQPFCHCYCHSSDEQACSYQRLGGGSLLPDCTADLGPSPAGAGSLEHLITLPRGFWINSLLWRQWHRVPSGHSISTAICIKKQWKKHCLDLKWELVAHWLFPLCSQQDDLRPCLHRGLGAELPSRLAKHLLQHPLAQLLARPWLKAFLKAGLWDEMVC